MCLHFCALAFYFHLLSMSVLSSLDTVLNDVAWPSKWPYTSADFEREDDSDDSLFYSQPRLVSSKLLLPFSFNTFR